MAASGDSSKVVGIIMIVVGVLILLGQVTVGWLVPLLGLVLLVLGILVLANVVSGSKLFGVVVLVLGILLLTGFLDVPPFVTRAIDLIVGIVLLVLGIMRLTR